jgi:hypothetical protein
MKPPGAPKLQESTFTPLAMKVCFEIITLHIQVLASMNENPGIVSKFKAVLADEIPIDEQDYGYEDQKRELGDRIAKKLESDEYLELAIAQQRSPRQKSRRRSIGRKSTYATLKFKRSRIGDTVRR